MVNVTNRVLYIFTGAHNLWNMKRESMVLATLQVVEIKSEVSKIRFSINIQIFVMESLYHHWFRYVLRQAII